MKHRNSRWLAHATLWIILCTSAVFAVAPTLRDEVSLNGSWSGGNVPHNVSSSATDNSTFTLQRSISIPTGWAGKRIFLELETVNWGDVTTIDGVQAGSSTGGWLPHSYDITARVTPGQTHSLTINGGGSVPGSWPEGFRPGQNFWNRQVYNIALRAYGMVAIRDAEVITSVANKTITVKYEVQNFNTTSKTVTINANVIPSTGGASALTLSTGSASLAAGEKRIVTATSAWTNPNLWWPTDPKLYLLCSSVKDAGATIDSQTVRFGFRECKVAGRYITLNGVRVNFRGESIEMRSFNYPTDAAGMVRWINVERSVNANSIRFHVRPPLKDLVEVCDEMGMMVEVEAPLWQSGSTGTTQTRDIWFPAWVKHFRNHASIVHWAGSNECYGSATSLAQLTSVIKANDGSGRPIWQEDVDHAGLETTCRHYPEGYGNLPTTGFLYDAGWISTTKPQGNGETVYSGATAPDYYYWQGLFSRGMRYNNVTLIHVYNYQNKWVGLGSDAKAQAYLNRSYNPIALFDYGYDGLGIGTIKDNSYPSIAAGSTASRTLILYNEDFADDIVSMQVDIKSGSTTHATVTKSYQVALGDHISVPCSFQVPYVGGSQMDLVLTTRKGGAQKFTESNRFNVTGSSSGASSSAITLGGGGIDPTTPFLQLSPASVSVNGTTGANVASQVIAVTNGGGGTLGTLTTGVFYGPGATGWVTPVVSGTGNARQITLQFGNSALNGGSFTAQLVVRSAGALPDSLVCPITLTQAGPDLTPPTILRASGTTSSVMVVFSEQVEGVSATAAGNYAISGGVTISRAVLGIDNATVTLTTSALANGTSYTVTVNNVTDRASPANRIANNSTATFAAGRAITKIRFYPRQDMAARMNGGRFEGTTGAVDGPYVTLYTIGSDPINNQWTEVTALQNADLGFTAVRYYSNGGFGNVAEVEFYSGDVKLTGTAFGTAGTWGGSTLDFTKAFDGDITTFFDCSQSVAFAGLSLNGGATTFRSGVSVARRGVVEIQIGGSAISLPTEGLALSGRRTLSVSDMRGRIVASVRLVTIDNERIDMPSIRLGPGCYTVVLEARSVKVGARLVVAR